MVPKEKNGLEFNLDIATEEQKERIKELEDLNIGPACIAELILVLLGLKQATDIGVYKWNDSLKKVMEVLKKSGLATAEMGKGDNENVVAELAVARTLADAERLANLDPSVNHLEFGEMMGYPVSAIDAFVNNTKLPRDSYPDMKGIIFHFALSEKNWQKEVDMLKYWSELIKKFAPKIYDELNVN